MRRYKNVWYAMQAIFIGLGDGLLDFFRALKYWWRLINHSYKPEERKGRYPDYIWVDVEVLCKMLSIDCPSFVGGESIFKDEELDPIPF